MGTKSAARSGTTLATGGRCVSESECACVNRANESACLQSVIISGTKGSVRGLTNPDAEQMERSGWRGEREKQRIAIERLCTSHQPLSPPEPLYCPLFTRHATHSHILPHLCSLLLSSPTGKLALDPAPDCFRSFLAERSAIQND